MAAPGHGGGLAVGRVRVGRLGRGRQVGGQAVLEIQHQTSTSRSSASARWRPDFTVPGGICSTSAISWIVSWA